jgi:hypothetical protein
VGSRLLIYVHLIWSEVVKIREIVMLDIVIECRADIFQDVFLFTIKGNEMSAFIDELEPFGIARTFPTCLSTSEAFWAFFVTLGRTQFQ